MKAKVMPDGRMSLPADLRRRHGLGEGGEVMVKDIGDRPGASVDDFLADRTRETEAE